MAVCLARSSTLNIPSPFLSAILGPKVIEVAHFSDCRQPSHTPFPLLTLTQKHYHRVCTVFLSWTECWWLCKLHPESWACRGKHEEACPVSVQVGCVLTCAHICDCACVYCLPNLLCWSSLILAATVLVRNNWEDKVLVDENTISARNSITNKSATCNIFTKLF